MSTSRTLPPLVSVMPNLSSLARHELGERPALARPDDRRRTWDPWLSLSAPRIFWMGAVKSVASRGVYSSWTTLAPSFSTCSLVGGHPVLAEGVVLGDGGDLTPGLGHGQGIGDGVLARVPARAEDVAVPRLARDAVGHRRLDDEDLLELLRPRAGSPAPPRWRWCPPRGRPCRPRRAWSPSAWTTSGLSWSSSISTSIFRPSTSPLPPVAYSRPSLKPVTSCLA